MGWTARRGHRVAVLVAVALGAGVGGAAGQGPGYPELTLDAELRLALSAGPLTVSEHADVYVMGRRGFERAVEGDNGWACLVVRSAANRIQLAPHCLNPQAVQTVLPAMLLEGELQARGLDAEGVEGEMFRRWEDGSLPLLTDFTCDNGYRLEAD